jgi:MFS family permease
MACIVLVQLLNSADWSVILPITYDIAHFIGEDFTYGGILVASLYFPFPISLLVFRWLKSYKWAYAFWAVSCVLGNLMYVVFLIYTRSFGVTFWLILARFVQGMAQCVTVRQILLSR